MTTTSSEPAPRGGRFIVDNSVWARLRTSPSVRRALTAIIDTHSPVAIMVCAPVVADVGFSARSGSDLTTLMGWLNAFPDCPVSPTAEGTLQIQNAIWSAGLVRAVGAMDVLIAAYALANGATVLHYDSDFEHVAHAMPGFTHRWIVPRGSV